eukprot:s127_g13.t1
MHNQLEGVLNTACEQFFPRERGRSQQIANRYPTLAALDAALNVGFKQLWQLRRSMQQHTAQSPSTSNTLVWARHCFAAWAYQAQYQTMSKALHKRSRHRKQARWNDIAEKVSAANERGDSHAMHAALRQLQPWVPRKRLQFRDANGKLQGPNAELRTLAAHCKATFAVHFESTPSRYLSASVSPTAAELHMALAQTGLAKAVPTGSAPTAAWRVAAAAASEYIASHLLQWGTPGAEAAMARHWKDAEVAFTPKPAKPPSKPENLRPLGLITPPGKAIASWLRSRIEPRLVPLIRTLPQYAYSAKRSSLDALLRVNSHFWRVQGHVQGTLPAIYQRKAGVTNPQCYGGITLSVDLKGAFNEVPRDLLYQCLEQLGVDRDTLLLVRQLHWEATYWLRPGSGGVGVVTSNGIKQGCRVAPTLWNCYTVTLLQMLCQKLSHEHVLRCLTLFADDLISTQEFRTWEDALDSVRSLEVVLTTLETMGMVINFDKTAVLLSANGTLARKLRRLLTVKVSGRLCVVLRVSAREVHIPVVAPHVYLGTVISHKHGADKTVRHRVQVAGHKWQKLKRALRCRHMLTRGKRTQIWTAGVRSSMLYGLANVQFGASSRQALRSKVARQLRHIAHLPAHVTGISNQELHAIMHAPDPVSVIRETLENRLHQLEVVEREAPDEVVCYPPTLEYARALLELRKQHESQEHHTARIIIAEPILLDSSMRVLNAGCTLQVRLQLSNTAR